MITFQPNKDFTGTPEPAKVVAADKNGTKVETTYTPTVTPVEPEGQDKTESVKSQSEREKKRLTSSNILKVRGRPI